MNRLRRWLDDLPTTPLIVTTGCALAVLTGVVTMVMFLIEITPSEVIYGSWLAFVAGTLGIGYKHFAKKRDTYVAPPSGQTGEIPAA